MIWGNLTDIPKKTLINPLAGLMIVLYIASGVFFNIAKSDTWPNPSVVGSFITFGLAVVTTLLSLAFAISDSRFDRMIKLKDDDMKQMKSEYLTIISTLESLLASSAKRDHAYNDMQTKSYESKKSNETLFGGLAPVIDETTKS